MGYSTDYNGALFITPAISPAEAQFINMWLNQRHVLLDVDALKENFPSIPTVDSCAPGEYGWNVITSWQGYGECPFAFAVLDNNRSGEICPSLWSDLKISEDGSELAWNGTEKTYEMERWIELVSQYILLPMGSTVNGEMEFQGEREDDFGVLVVTDGHVEKIFYEEE